MLESLPQGAARDLADELNIQRSKTARANAGAGLAVSIPWQRFLRGVYRQRYAHGRVSSSIDQNDIQYLRDIQHENVSRQKQTRCFLLLKSDEIAKAFKLYRVGAGSDCIRLRYCAGEFVVARCLFPLALRQNCKNPPL